MKKVILLCIVIFIVSCKEKPVEPIVSAAPKIVDYCKEGHLHIHYYKVYTGKFSVGNSGNDEFDSCTFGGEKMKYYKNSIAASQNGKEIKVYYKVIGIDTIIIPINPKISRYHNPRESSPISPEEIVLKGDYGCIPNFISNGSENIHSFTEDNKEFINLNIALHDDINRDDSTVAVLRNHTFEISKNDFKKLDSTYKVNPYIQGGICKSAMTTMQIYNELDSLLFSVSK